MDLYSEFFNIASRFRKEKIKYAVVGGIAMAFHDIPRFTRDMDFLVFPKDISKIRKIMNDMGYSEFADPWNFKKTELTIHRFVRMKGKEHALVDILAGNDSRHKKIIEKSVQSQSQRGAVNVANREDLIWMKAIRNSDQDKVDIKRLKNDKD